MLEKHPEVVWNVEECAILLRFFNFLKFFWCYNRFPIILLYCVYFLFNKYLNVIVRYINDCRLLDCFSRDIGSLISFLVTGIADMWWLSVLFDMIINYRIYTRQLRLLDVYISYLIEIFREHYSRCTFYRLNRIRFCLRTTRF